MNNKKKKLLDVLGRTERLIKDINNIESKVEDDDFLNDFIGHFYKNAENNIKKAKEGLNDIYNQKYED